MGVIGGISGGAGSSIKNPTTLRYTIASTNTEESISLPSGTKAYRIQNVGSRLIKIAYATGDIASGKYFTLFPFGPLDPIGIINQNSVTIYLESSGLETIELDIWR